MYIESYQNFLLKEATFNFICTGYSEQRSTLVIYSYILLARSFVDSYGQRQNENGVTCNAIVSP